MPPLAKLIDACRERIYSTPMFDPAISSYTQAVGELKGQGLSKTEIEVELAGRGLPSIDEAAWPITRSLLTIVPLSIFIAAAMSFQKLSGAVVNKKQDG